MDKKNVFLLLAALFALLTYFAAAAKELLESPFDDFGHYYQNAILLNDGYDIWQEDEPYRQAAEGLSRKLGIMKTGFAVHSSGYFLFILPFTLLAFKAAVLASMFLGHLLLFLSLWFVLRIFRDRFRWEDLLAVCFLVFAFWPMREQLHMNQPNLFILFLVCCAALLMRRGKMFLAGLVLGMTFQFREYLAVSALLFVWKRDWKTLGGMCAGFLLLKSAAIAAFGWDLELSYWKHMIRHFGAVYDFSTVSQNLSFMAAAHRVGKGVIPQSAVSAVILTVNALFCVLALRAAAGRRPVSAISFCLFLTLAYLVTPWVHESHYVVVLIAVAAAWFGIEDKPRRYALFIVAYLLLGLRYALFRFPGFSYGLPAALNFVKPCGLILLFALLYRQSREGYAG